VVVSNVSSLPEIVGRAGLTVNPYDSDQIASAISQAIKNHDARSEMVKRGLERAKFFSWKQTAEKTLDLYETVLNQK
jgi:glycosyltransferase involved in cell wall biosynthesis